MYPDVNFRILEDHTFSTIISEIEKVYRISLSGHEKVTSSVYDTFDWRIYKSGHVLFYDGHTATLKDAVAGSREFEEPPVRNSLPSFWWEFNNTAFLNVIKKIIDVRALMKYIEIEDDYRTYNILNKDSKTVVRIAHHFFFGTDTNRTVQKMECVEIIPLKGYDKEHGDVRKILSSLELKELTENPVVSFIRTFGIEPGIYSPKVEINLDPDEECSRALKKIFKHLLSVIKQNENCVKKDIDTECLHDFRVAIRRTRSALSQIKNVFPQPEYERFTADFKYFGKMSNRLRDLDVYLLNSDRYLEMVPPELKPGLPPLFQSLKKERRKEFRTFAKKLSGKKYKKTIADWEMFLDAEIRPDSTMTNASRPIIDVAKEYVAARHKKIIKVGNKITPETPDEKLHRLRIHCKKLRYLLEFFASLFPQKEISRYIKQLKIMQDYLGEYNDFSVQQDDLSKHLSTIKPSEPEHILEVAAIGALIALLKRKQNELRGGFSEVFNAFSSKKNIAVFHKLFE